VRILHIRANADSLDLVLRELVDDDTALETSVDGHKLDIMAKEFLVDRAGSLAELGIGLSGPSRAIRSVLDLLAAIKGRVSNHEVGEGGERLVDGRTSKDLDLKRAVLLEAGDRDRLGSLDKGRNSLAPLPDTVVKTADGLESSAGGREGESLRSSRSVDLGEDHLRLNLDLAVGLLETLKDLLHCGEEFVGLGSRQSELDSGKGWDGVVGVATVHLGDAVLSTGDGSVVLEQHLNDPHSGVGTADLDIDTAVATLEVLEGEGVVDPSLVVNSTAHGEAEDTIDTTSAAESDLSPILRVDVDEVLGILGKKLALLQAKSTNKTSLLINGEEELERTVDKLLVLTDGKSSSNTATIITTKSGLGSTEKITIDVRNEGISLKVVLDIGSLGGHHIKMALKNDARAVLLALGGRKRNADIAKSISLHSAADLLADLLDPLGDLLSVVRGTRDLSEGEEVPPHSLAFRILLAEFLINLLLDVQMKFCHCAY